MQKYNFINKISFPFEPNTDEKNGGFYEGFANLMYTGAYDEILTENSQRELNETIQYGKFFSKNFHAYVNDLDATPYNSLALWQKVGPQDPSRGSGAGDAPSYNGGSILKGIIDEFNISFGQFLSGLQNLVTPTTIDESLSNIALATAYATGKNVVPFFKNVLKFKEFCAKLVVLTSVWLIDGCPIVTSDCPVMLLLLVLTIHV